MPDLGSSTFSQTDANNNSGTMPSWSGAAAPSTLDDAGRALQGAVTREWNWRSYTLTAGGTADAKTLTYSVAPASYYNGQRFAFIANTTNTGSATLNVNSLGAKTIKKVVAGVLTNLSSGDMVSGAFVEVAYNLANDCFVWTGAVDSPYFTSIELGNASDTTITRSAAGVIAVEGGVIPKENRANTFSADQRIDANLGLGAAPVSKLHVDGASFVNGGSSLPALSATLVTGEIHAGTGNSLASDSGHLRLSAGGGTTLGVKAAIDLYRENGGGTGIIAYTTGTERLRVDASGNVLVGTSTSESGKLQVFSIVDGNTVSAAFKNVSNLSANTAVSVDLVSDQSTSRLTSYRDGTGNGSSLAISTSNAGTLFERMRIDTSGNVGVGTTSPSSYGKFAVVASSGATAFSLATAAGNYVTSTITDGGDVSLVNFSATSTQFTVGTTSSTPLRMITGNSERMRIDASGNVGIGTTSPALYGKLAVIGGAIYTDNALYSSDGTTTSRVISSGAVSYWGTTTNHPVAFQTNNVERMRIDTSGNVLVTSSGGLGYGTGSGGTVTQITSKATGVTINKTNGQIITHNASLGAASEVSFTVTNSTVAATDNIILTKVSGGTATRYQLYVGAVAAGSFVVSIRNVDSTAQSDVITFNFAVIKSVTS